MATTVLGKLMAKKGLKNVEIARNLCISEVRFSAWKCGHEYVPPKHRRRLAEALNVEVEDILDERGLARLAEEEATLR